MKIVHILNELKFSGAELLLHSSAHILNDGGNYNIVLSTGSVVGEFSPYLTSKGFEIHHLPFRRSPFYFFSLWKKLRQLEPDVIHIHAERANFLIGLLSLTAGRRVVRSVHNTFEFEGSLRRIRSLERRALGFLGVKQLAASPSVQRNEAYRFKNKTIVANNWFDPERIVRVTSEIRSQSRAKLNISAEELFLVSIGNYGPAKNQEAIIDVVRRVKPLMRVRYIHCGGGGEGLAAKMHVSSDDPISFAGAVSDIRDYLTACDAFVSPSYFEAGPISLLEAAAAGAFCIVTNVGLAELFEGQPNVVFIEPNADSLFDALVALSKTSLEDRLDGGAVLAEFANANFSPEAGCLIYLNSYKK